MLGFDRFSDTIKRTFGTFRGLKKDLSVQVGQIEPEKT